MTLTANSCGLPPDIPHASNRLPQPTPAEGASVAEFIPDQTVVYYDCVDGFSLRDAIANSLTCAAGQWEGPLPICDACPEPAPILHGYYTMYPDVQGKAGFTEESKVHSPIVTYMYTFMLFLFLNLLSLS